MNIKNKKLLLGDCANFLYKIMKKLSKQQRLQAYIFSYFQVNSEIDCGVCFILEQWCYETGTDIHWSFSYDENTREYFPEFYAQKPSPNSGGEWWKTNKKKKRQEALLRAIDLLFEN